MNRNEESKPQKNGKQASNCHKQSFVIKKSSIRINHEKLQQFGTANKYHLNQFRSVLSNNSLPSFTNTAFLISN